MERELRNGQVIQLTLDRPADYRTYEVRTGDRTQYVSATSEDEALAIVRSFGLQADTARLMFGWLGELRTDPGEKMPDEDGLSRPDATGARAKHPRTREVLDWLRDYAGRSSFVLDVQHKVKHGRQATGRNVGGRKAYRLSFAQVEALAKVKDEDEKRAKQRAELGTGLNLWAILPYGTTYAAAENERGAVSFVKMDKVEKGKWAEWVFVKAVIGGNEDMRLGSQRPDEEDYRGQWAVVLANVCRDVVAAVERYGKELGVCGVCGARLTNEESRKGGIGPVCRAKLGRAA